MPLTTDLILKYSAEWKRAINHPFLQQAGQGSIDQSILTQWLRQDYLYAYIGYIKFASLLLSRLHISANPDSSSSQAIQLLTFSLANVKRETDFFVQTAKECDLDLHPNGKMPDVDPLLGPYNEVTRAYVDFLIATAAGGSVEEGLVLLWAMEEAYLAAWRYASIHRTEESRGNTLLRKALESFIDNWTCDEFVGFVSDCKEVVDALDIAEGSEMAKRCEAVFKRTLWLEQRFWPSVTAASL